MLSKLAAFLKLSTDHVKIFGMMCTGFDGLVSNSNFSQSIGSVRNAIIYNTCSFAKIRLNLQNIKPCMYACFWKQYIFSTVAYIAIGILWLKTDERL